MTYFLVKLHPNLVDDRQPHHEGLFRAADEKVQCVRDFYEKKRHIPLCVDHCGAARGGFVVPEQDRIGHVKDLFIDKHGQVIAKLKLDSEHPEARRITQEMVRRNQAWGASVWIDVGRDGGPRGPILSKDLTHVALTTDPYFAKHNTFIRDIAPEGHERALDKYVARNLFTEGECFTGDAYASKLKGMCILNGGTDLRLTHCTELTHKPAQKTMSDPTQQQQQQPPAQQQQQQAPPQEGDPTKRQRLNDGTPQTLGRQQVVQPHLEEYDPEDALKVKQLIASLDSWMDTNDLKLRDTDLDVQTYYGNLLGCRGQHHKKITENLNEAMKYGFNLDDLNKIKNPQERDVFYDMVACNTRAMTDLQSRLAKAEQELEGYKATPPPQQTGYGAQKSYTAPNNNNGASNYAAQRTPDTDVLSDAAVNKIFGTTNWRDATTQKQSAYTPSAKPSVTYNLPGVRNSVAQFLST